VEQSVRSFTVEDLRGFHTAWFRPGNAVLVVVGDVRAASVLPLLEAAFGRWEAGATPTPRWGEAAQVRRRDIYLVDKPGAAQTEIIIGRIGVPRSTADYYALTVMNTILGGSFTSRLNNNLREDKGYTYGAGSSFAFDRLAGPFSARAAVHTAVTDKALAEFFKELRGIRERVPAEELDRAKNYVALRFPERFEAVSSVARQLGELYVYDLPADYYNQYTRRILAVTAADVQRVARQYVDPERVTVVLVGDRSKIEAGVRALRLGQVQTLTVEQVLGPVPVVAVN
jgi:predicted Zn-dependent peptidase